MGFKWKEIGRRSTHVGQSCDDCGRKVQPGQVVAVRQFNYSYQTVVVHKECLQKLTEKAPASRVEQEQTNETLYWEIRNRIVETGEVFATRS